MHGLAQNGKREGPYLSSVYGWSILMNEKSTGYQRLKTRHTKSRVE